MTADDLRDLLLDRTQAAAQKAARQVQAALDPVR
jgi:hypothetical protein